MTLKKWPLERWLLIANLCVGTFGGIWFLSSQWSQMKADVAGLQASMKALTISVQQNQRVTNDLRAFVGPTPASRRSPRQSEFRPMYSEDSVMDMTTGKETP